MRPWLLAGMAFVSAVGFGQGRSSDGPRPETYYVRGYYRRDGKFVVPRYRSYPQGWKSLGRLTGNPFSGKLGKNEYPLGAWVNPRQRDRVYNTPFLGITADYGEVSRVVIQTSDPETGVPIRATITFYRAGSRKKRSVTSWQDFSSEVMLSGEKSVAVDGVTSEGKPFKATLSVLGADSWSGIDSPAQEFVPESFGITRDLRFTKPVVKNCRNFIVWPGDTITAIRFGTDEWHDVYSWDRITDYLKTYDRSKLFTIRVLRNGRVLEYSLAY